MASLKETRIRNRKTQQQMAKLLNIGISTYNQYENSERDIPYKIAKSIAEMFGLELEDIFLPTRFTVSKKIKEDKLNGKH